MGLELLPHNLRAYNNVIEKFKTSDRTCVIQPTGTGKTYIAYKLIEDNPGKKVLWIGPSNYVYELQLQNLCKDGFDNNEDVTFRTFNWLSKNAGFCSDEDYEIIIIDEFHRAGAPVWGNEIVDIVNKNESAKILGLSATPIRYLDNMRDMGEEIFNNNIASEMTLIEAMAEGILPLPKYVIGSYKINELVEKQMINLDKMSNKKVREENAEIYAKLRRSIENAEGMSELFKKHLSKKDAKLIVFTPNIRKLFDLMAQVLEWFKDVDEFPHVYAVHTENSEAEKDFKDFDKDNSNHLRLLFVVDMLNEGIHVSDVDGVILLRPTISPILYRQQIGRALASGGVTQPLIFDLVNNFEFVDNVYSLKSDIQNFEQGTTHSKNHVNLGGFIIVDELKEARMLFEKLQLSNESVWYKYFERYKRFVEENGVVPLASKYVTEDGYYLGKWVINQKILIKNKKLDEQKENLLREVGIDTRSNRQIKFDHWIEVAKKYQAEHGDIANITHDYVTEDGENLGTWIMLQKNNEKHGRLSPEDKKRIEDVGIWLGKSMRQWMERYNKVKAQYDKDGYIKKKDNETMYGWLRHQIRKYNGVGDPLNDEQRRLLEELGISLEYKPNEYDNTFEDNINLLQEYYSTKNKKHIPSTYKASDGTDLGKWARRIRDKKNAGKLMSLWYGPAPCPASYITIEQERMLDDIGFSWGNERK